MNLPGSIAISLFDREIAQIFFRGALNGKRGAPSRAGGG